MNIVIKIGGHLLFSEKGINTSLLKRYANIITQLYDNGLWAVVTGGGELARKYVVAARELGLDESISDSIAIQITRVNARLLAHLLSPKAYQAIPESIDQLREYASLNKIVVLGGLQPGQSTVAVAALSAEALKADKLIIATDVEGIYTDDPKKNPNAKLLKETTVKHLQQILQKTSHQAGEYKLIDALALKILTRSKIPTIYLDGRDPENLRKALLGESVGTLVKPE